MPNIRVSPFMFQWQRVDWTLIRIIITVRNIDTLIRFWTAVCSFARSTRWAKSSV